MGNHLRVFCESFQMSTNKTGFELFLIFFAFLCWTKEFPALEWLTWVISILETYIIMFRSWLKFDQIQHKPIFQFQACSRRAMGNGPFTQISRVLNQTNLYGRVSTLVTMGTKYAWPAAKHNFVCITKSTSWNFNAQHEWWRSLAFFSLQWALAVFYCTEIPPPKPCTLDRLLHNLRWIKTSGYGTSRPTWTSWLRQIGQKCFAHVGAQASL